MKLKKKIRIVSDSACDVKTLDGVDFKAVPLKIITSEKEYTDDENLDIEKMIYELSKYKGTSSTSCPNSHEWEEAFSGADEVFGVTITGTLSGSYNAAELAKANFEKANKKAHIIDSLSTGPEMLLILHKLKDLIEQGLDFEEITKQIEEYRGHVNILYALESLHNLAQNGRVSKIVASMAGMLGIRVLGTASEHGTLEPIGKFRGEKKTILAFLEHLEKKGYKGGKVIIAHCLNPLGAEALRKEIRMKYPLAKVDVIATGALCSYYAEKGGILLGFEF